MIRAVDLNLLPGVSSDEGEGDEWPPVHEKLLAAEILVLATPTWFGQPSSVVKRVLERMDAMLSETDDAGLPVAFNRVAGFVVTGNEDGAHHVIAELAQAVNDIGYTVPAQAWTYWNKGPGPARPTSRPTRATSGRRRRRAPPQATSSPSPRRSRRIRCRSPRADVSATSDLRERLRGRATRRRHPRRDRRHPAGRAPPLPAAPRRRVWAKLEASNPGGSAKDRPAARMLQDALDHGLIDLGTTVVESTSGNTGVGLAQACRYHGMRLICVVDTRAHETNVRAMRALGADVRVVAEPDRETGDLLVARLALVEQLLAEIPNSFWPDQYANESNPTAHASGTMREIDEALEGRLDYLFVATSTTGTLRGCGDYLREHGRSTRVVAVDSTGSALSAAGAAPAGSPASAPASRPIYPRAPNSTTSCASPTSTASSAAAGLPSARRSWQAPPRAASRSPSRPSRRRWRRAAAARRSSPTAGPGTWRPSTTTPGSSASSAARRRSSRRSSRKGRSHRCPRSHSLRPSQSRVSAPRACSRSSACSTTRATSHRAHALEIDVFEPHPRPEQARSTTRISPITCA